MVALLDSVLLVASGCPKPSATAICTFGSCPLRISMSSFFAALWLPNGARFSFEDAAWPIRLERRLRSRHPKTIFGYLTSSLLPVNADSVVRILPFGECVQH